MVDREEAIEMLAEILSLPINYQLSTINFFGSEIARRSTQRGCQRGFFLG